MKYVISIFSVVLLLTANASGCPPKDPWIVSPDYKLLSPRIPGGCPPKDPWIVPQPVGDSFPVPLWRPFTPPLLGPGQGFAPCVPGLGGFQRPVWDDKVPPIPIREPQSRNGLVRR